jgi:cytochrome c oxidase subunit 3
MGGEASKPIDKAVLWGGGRSPLSTTYGKQMMWFFLVSDALTFSGLLTAYGFSRYKAEAWADPEAVFQSLPFIGDGWPLIYVALMTFILIVSSVTMVLAVEAGHRNYKKGVVKWMFWTVIGGAFFVGSQAWEWYHFISGSAGGAMLSAQVDPIAGDETSYSAEWFQVVVDAEKAEAAGFHGHGVEPKVEILEGLRLIKGNVMISVEEHPALVQSMYNERQSHIFGANMTINEYSPEQPQFGNFFFFITGFHGFHVFSGVIINLIIFIMVTKGVMHKRGHYEMVEKVGLYWHFVDLVWVFVFTFFYLV